MAINFTFGLGHLLASGGHDATLSSPTQKANLGDIIYLRDKLGSRYLKYNRSVATAAMAQGKITAKFGDANGLTAITNILSGSTIHAVTSGLTAGTFEGGLCYVRDVNAVAGAAPEGEVAIVKQNSTTRIDFDDKYPLSAALAVNDDLTIEARNTVILSASGDNVNRVSGAIVAESVAVADYFWTQFSGLCRVVTEATIAPLVGAQAMCAATTAGAVDGVGASTAFVDVIGYFRFAIATNDIVNDFGWINIACDEASSLVLSTLDATA